ncbi:MAG: Xaa-Pro peptidase family protein [Anaerolineales bacterium]
MKTDLDRLMSEQGLEALLVFGDAQHNAAMYYFTGGGHVSHALLIKPRQAPAVLFHNDMEREEAARSGLQCVSFSRYPLSTFLKQTGNDMQQALSLRLQAMLRDLGITRGKVAVYGMDEIGSAWALLSRLAKDMPELEIVGDSPALPMAMETKDEAEIARIRRMGAITTRVVGRVAEWLSESAVAADETLLKEDGTPLTVGDVKRKIHLWLVEEGVENPKDTIFAPGREAGIPHSTGTPDLPLRLGQTIVFDIFPCEAGGGYFYDFTRTWCLGYATDEAQALYEQVKAAYDLAVRSLQIGIPFRDVHRRVCELFESQGHPTPLHRDAPPIEGYVHSLGHGVGLNIHERPFSSLQGEEQRLNPGCVITIEPGLYYPDRGLGVRIEDTFWMRPDGTVERLAEFPHDLVLPMKRWKR